MTHQINHTLPMEYIHLVEEKLEADFWDILNEKLEYLLDCFLKISNHDYLNELFRSNGFNDPQWMLGFTGIYEAELKTIISDIGKNKKS